MTDVSHVQLRIHHSSDTLATAAKRHCASLTAHYGRIQFLDTAAAGPSDSYDERLKAVYHEVLRTAAPQSVSVLKKTVEV